MRKNIEIFTFIIIVMMILCSAFIGGFLASEYFNRDENQYQILSQAVTILQNHALDELPTELSLEYGMIRGMLDAYGDPHSTFVEPVQHELESNLLAGTFGGIGVKLEYSEEGYVILFPYPDSPSELAGIRDGDQLLQVDDIEIGKFQPIDEVTAAIRGPEGETIVLLVAREQRLDPIKFTLERESIPLPSITWHLHQSESHLGIIDINIISASTPNEVTEAIKSLKKQGATHLIIDLRGNSGGLLSAGVDTARLFLPKGIILQEQARDRGVKTYSAANDGPFLDIPVAILVDHGTASASEIIAGALKARSRAVIIGETTYGKDSIQLVFDLKDGSSLHITSARWWVPGLDVPIRDNGIQPDILAPPNNAGQDTAIIIAKNTLLNEE
jgi:carboxyl-terminal processing protease